MQIHTSTHTIQKTSRLSGLLALVLVLLVAPSVSAATGSTTVSETLAPGALTLVVQPVATLGLVNLNGTGSQSSTGSLGLNTVADGRGTGAGWSLTATTSAFSSIGTPAQVVGSAGSLVSGGSYSGTSSGTYTVTIVNAGALGTATYAISGLESQAAAVTGAGVALGTKGLTLTFGTGNYTVGEQWTIAVNVIPASNVTITPSAVSAVSGATTGVTAGSSYTFTSGSDPASIMTATATNGLGTYTNTPTISLAIPSGTKAGVYTATVTETAT